MTRVLLIADTERVQRIFQSMAEQGSLQLQTASTLPLGELELTASSPEFTFVQSRISGFSGDILLRHLDKMLPSGGKLVLLAGDSEDAAQAKRQGRTSLDLSMTDAFLERSVAALLAGIALPEPPGQEQPVEDTPAQEPQAPEPQVLETAAAAKRTAARTKGGAPVPDATAAAAGKEAGLQDEEEVETPAFVPFQPKAWEPAAFTPKVPEPEVSEPKVAEEYPQVPLAAGKAAASAFEEVMQRAETDIAPIDASMLEVEDHVEVGRKVVDAASRQSPSTAAAADETMVVGGGYYAGETVAEALRKAQQTKRRRPYLFIVPVLLLLAVPLVSYLAGKMSAPPEKPVAKPGSPYKPGSTPPAVQTAPKTAAPVQSPVPVAPPAAKVTPAPSAPVQPQAAPKKGIEKLPEMLEGTKLDAEYGRKNPGWVRYVGLRAEYKLFKENNLYRAIQVIPVSGGVISDDLFKRVLRQFGAVESYRVESSAPKDGYVIEQCSAPGDLALTIYRHKDSSKIKALVVYYR
ncbi:hypothetical protein E4633_03225 [Geomonas terrae]|uniref:Uncharacterized protein n=1 Tax=Geomonas terrae TaxID=2562681 RepID=A0A4S1CL49_9BACT|nr:hypothetical protein [Geomonas terrae]TGU74488.1 hypothetical protein E4633_03225 [Geomonas terrae]